MVTHFAIPISMCNISSTILRLFFLSELHVSNYQRIQDLEAELNSAKQAKTKQLSGSQQLLAKLEALEKENLDLRREKGELQEELDTLQLGVDIKDSELANWLTQLR